MPFTPDAPAASSGGFTPDAPTQGAQGFTPDTPAAPTPAPSPDMVSQLHPLVTASAKKHGVDAMAMATMIGMESSGGRNPGVSSAGAQGVAQFMPDTAKQYGVKDPNDPAQAIDGMGAYMADLVKRYHGDYRLAAMAYNAGPGAVDKYLAGQGSLSPETFNYGAGFEQGYDRRKKLEAAGPALASHHIAEAGFIPKGAAETVLGRKSIVRPALKAAETTASNLTAMTGLHFLDAILGAPQRMIEGIANEHEKNHTVMPIGMDGREIMHGLGVMFHPNDEKMQTHETETLTKNVLAGFGIHSADKGLKGALETLAVQTASDPTTYIPVAGELKVGSKVLQALKEAHEALPEGHIVRGLVQELASKSEALSKNQLVQSVAWLTRARPEMNRFVTDKGKAAAIAIENRYHSQFDKLAKADEALLPKGVKSIEELKPEQKEALRRRIMAEGWMHGNPEIRAEAIRAGFKPNANEEKMFPDPTGTMTKKHIHDYENILAGSTDRTNMAKDFRSRYGAEGKRASLGGEPGEQTVIDKLRTRMTDGRRYAQNRLVDAEREAFFRAHPQEFKGAYDVLKLSHEPKSLESHPLGAAVSSLTSPIRNFMNASVLGNPLPHGFKNVGELAGLSGGAPTFFRGLMHAVTGSAGSSATWMREATNLESGKLLDRMERMGLSMDYSHDVAGGLFKIPGMKQVGAVGQKVVERLENGFRAATLEQADKVLGPSRTIADEYAKSKFVTDHLGDYRNVNGIVQMLKMIGGPFVAFRLGIVPAAVGRAALRRPGRIETINRAQDDYSQAVLPKGVHAEIGGPAEDFGKLINPGTTRKFLESPATIGPFGLYSEYQQQAANHQLDVNEIGADALRQIPGGSIPLQAAEMAGFDPYSKTNRAPKGVSPLGLALLTAIGGYYKQSSAKGEKYERQQNRKQDKKNARSLDADVKELTTLGNLIIVIKRFARRVVELCITRLIQALIIGTFVVDGFKDGPRRRIIWELTIHPVSLKVRLVMGRSAPTSGVPLAHAPQPTPPHYPDPLHGPDTCRIYHRQSLN